MKLRIKAILSSIGFLTVYIYIKETLFPNEQIKLENGYKKSRIAFHKTFIKSNDLVFDIGANWGNRTAIYLNIGARVVAFEPLKNCFEYLKNKFLFQHCTVINKGVGSSNRIQPLYKPDNADTIASFSTDYIEKTEQRFGEKKWSVVSEIEIVTLDSMIAKYGIPQFIKIDVEGYEVDVLKGLSKKVNIVSFEFTIPELHNQLFECLHLLSNLGEITCNYTQGENTFFAHDSWITKQALIDETMTFQERAISWGDIYVKFV